MIDYLSLPWPWLKGEGVQILCIIIIIAVTGMRW